MKVLYYCGLAGCEKSGTLNVSPTQWQKRLVEAPCPACGALLRQRDLHFEDYNVSLHMERAAICHRPGPMTDADKARLREIHELLGHGPAEEFTPEQESLVMKIASEVWQRVRNEEKN
jgi:hypothetical protein